MGASGGAEVTGKTVDKKTPAKTGGGKRETEQTTAVCQIVYFFIAFKSTQPRRTRMRHTGSL